MLKTLKLKFAKVMKKHFVTTYHFIFECFLATILDVSENGEL